MNNQLQIFARNQILCGLCTCTKEQVLLFKRMYSHEDLEANIKDVVRKMPEDKLDWAMQQVEKTIKGNRNE